MSIRHLDKLLLPRSVVVVGPSPRVGSVGATVWRNLHGCFAGPLYAVNLRHEALDDHPVYRPVDDLPEPPDLAILCTPPDTVPELVRALGRRGTHAVAVLTAGLNEAQRKEALMAAQPIWCDCSALTPWVC